MSLYFCLEVLHLNGKFTIKEKTAVSCGFARRSRLGQGFLCHVAKVSKGLGIVDGHFA